MDQRRILNLDGMVKLTHFSGVQLEPVIDLVHTHVTASKKTQAVSDEQTTFMVSSMSEGVANNVFNELPSKMVVWDEDILSDCNTHGGLQQLTLGVECMGQEKVVLQTKCNMWYFLVYAAQHFFCHNGEVVLSRN